MEGAGKLVEDEELREAMSEKGLGTPATRAAIIEGLIYEKYVHRHGRELQPTAKAFSLMALLQRAGHPGTDQAGTDRRLGIQAARRCSAGKSTPRRVHAGDRGHDPRRSSPRPSSIEHDTMPGDFGVLKVPCPEVRRRGARELQEVPVPGSAISPFGRSWPAACSRSEEVEELIAEEPGRARCRVSAASWAGLSPPSLS